MYWIKCDSENNTPEIIERNELVATICLTPYKWANDESYVAWQNPEIRKTKNWVLNEFGEVEMVP